MHHNHCTVTPAFVRAVARLAIAQALPFKGYGRLATAQKILDVLLLAAALAASLSWVVRRFRFGFSHETARKAIDSNLPDLDSLTTGLLDALYTFGSRALYRRRWVIAIDEHRDPFYGDRSTPGVTGGQKKHGSKYAYSYATAVIVHLRHRFTVGLLALTGGEKPHEIVQTLLEQIHKRGLKLRGVVLDSAFDSGETILLLQEKVLSYSVPLRKKGNGSNPRNDFWEMETGTVAEVGWKTKKTRKAVSTQVVVVQRPKEKEKRVYAFGGWGADEARSQRRRAALAKRWYRKRFGIETSYRQMRQCKAKTTKKDIRYRLLVVGIALLLRQAWVWLTRQVARQLKLKPSQWVAVLPLAKMADWLADSLKSKYKEEKVIRLPSPLPQLPGFSL
jgi:hypothetical protein